MKNVPVMIPEDLKNDLKAEAAKKGKGLSDYITQALILFLAMERKEK